jgi:hypothetical protein
VEASKSTPIDSTTLDSGIINYDYVPSGISIIVIQHYSLL